MRFPAIFPNGALPEPPPAPPGPTPPVVLTMAPSGAHAHGAITDELLLTGGAWAGWTVQLPVGTAALNESASGLALDFNVNSNVGPISRAAAPTSAGGIYREVQGDFDFEFIMQSTTGSTYKNVAAAAWARVPFYRHAASGTCDPYTAAQFNLGAGGWAFGSAFGGAKGVLGSWATGREFRIARVGVDLSFYERALGAGSWTQRYPTGSETRYDVVGTTCRVGIMFSNFGKGSNDSVLIPHASLTYTP